MSCLRTTLRAATRQAHETVDSLVGRFDLVSSADYASFLKLHGAAVLPAEGSVVDFGIERYVSDWRARTRSAAIRADLREAGIYDEFGQKLPFDIDFPRAIGILYVLEGSRVGSAYLLRRLDHGRANDAHRPTRFLRHNRHLPMWPTFLQWLSRQQLDAEGTSAAIDAAKAIFQLYERSAAQYLAATGKESR
jgi:heme oxygenase